MHSDHFLQLHTWPAYPSLAYNLFTLLWLHHGENLTYDLERFSCRPGTFSCISCHVI